MIGYDKVGWLNNPESDLLSHLSALSIQMATSRTMWFCMDREYYPINVEHGDLVYNVLERVLHERELPQIRMELAQVRRELAQVKEQLQKTREKARRERLEKEKLLLLEKENLLMLKESPQQGGRVASYSDLQVLSGPTVITLDERKPLCDLVESSAGESREQALYVIRESELSC